MPRHKKTKPRLSKAELINSAPLLLKCYTKPKETPEEGTLVWAKNFGSIYWPAFIVQLQDKPDIKPEVLAAEEALLPENCVNPAMVMFLEAKFRIAALPWERIIPLYEDQLEEQLDLIHKLNDAENKKSTGSKIFWNSIEYLKEFMTYKNHERRNQAQAKYAVDYPKDEEKKRRQSVPSGNKLAREDEAKPASSSSKEVNEQPKERKHGRYSLRTPPPPPSITTPSPSTKELTLARLKPSADLGSSTKGSEDGDLFDVGGDATEKAKKEGSRPKEGGRALKEWAADRFHLVDKTFRYESQKIVVCALDGCGKEINNGDTPVFCHDFPFHARCVKEISELENGKKVYKCPDCLEKRCFLCKSSTDKDCLKCSKCDLFYHVHCLRPFPQAEVQSPVGPITCPLHYCHTCIAEHAILKKVRNYKAGKGNSLRCIKCPTSYHRVCLPAPSLSTVMSNGFVICPRHQDFDLGNKFKRLGCFMCNKQLPKGSKGQQTLVNCSKCPLTYHMKCVTDETTFETPEEREKYRSTFECEGCFWGLFPLPGQAVLCRQAKFSFWPARILYPKEASQRAISSPHSFSIAYFGNQRSYFDGARCVRTVALNVAAYDVLQKLKMIPDDPKLITAYEEGTFVMNLSESHRAAILNEPEPLYKKIERNVYKTTTRKSKGGNRKERDSDIGYIKGSHCLCNEDNNANEICSVGSGCINRDQAIECNDKTCGDAERCTNRMFSRKTSDKIEAFATMNRGWGVRTVDMLKEGDFVVEYVGEIISKELYQWRLERKFCNDAHYFLVLDTNSFIDAEYMGNMSRLINHSCEPNCSTEKYISQGKPVVGVFAKYDIPPGTELTFDYAYEMGGNAAKTFSCCCGSTNCRGQVSNSKHMRNHKKQSGDLSPSQLRRDDEWKEYCEICLYTGEYLLCCEAPQCDKAYHADCLELSSVPKGTWICPDPEHERLKKPTSNNSKKRKSTADKTEESTIMNNDQENKKRKRSKIAKDEVVEVVVDHRETKAPLVPQETN